MQRTAKLYLPGLTGTTSHPDMQKIRIIKFSFKIGYIGSLQFGLTLFVLVGRIFYPAVSSVSLSSFVHILSPLRCQRSPHLFQFNQISAYPGVSYLRLFIFLDAFEILRKVATSLLISVRLSVSLSVHTETSVPTAWMCDYGVFSMVPIIVKFVNIWKR